MSPPKTFAFERCDASPKAFAIISVLFLSDRHWIKAVQLSIEEGLPKQLYMNLYHSQSLLRRLRILQDMSTVLSLRAKSIILAIISIFGVFSVCRIFYNKSQPLVNPSYHNPGGIKKRSSFYTGMEPQNRLSPSATTVSNEKCSIFDKLLDFRSNIPKEVREAHRRWLYFVRFNQSIQAFQIKAEFFFIFFLSVLKERCARVDYFASWTSAIRSPTKCSFLYSGHNLYGMGASNLAHDAIHRNLAASKVNYLRTLLFVFPLSLYNTII